MQLYFKHLLIFIGLVKLLAHNSCFAQAYTFPINPEKECLLTGNLGEIRGSHFHAGIDIAAQIGTPIYAAADGYIRRVIVSPYGYGKGIYVVHPQYKQQTVYGHIDRFSPRIEAKVIRYMYAEKINQLDWEVEKNTIPVKKGEIIAYSGNTGSSAGPHLHYEIRNMQDVSISPHYFKFKEMPKDQRPPELFKLALKTMDINSRLGEKFGRTVFPLKKLGKGQYRLEKIIEAQGAIGLEIFTEDRRSVSPFRFGVGKIELRVNGKAIYRILLDSIDHQYNRSMNVHINYAHQQRHKEAFQRCYLSDGNKLKTTYEALQGRGFINVGSNSISNVTLLVWDHTGNQSSLTFQIKGSTFKQKPLADNSPRLPQISHEIEENTLQVKVKYPKAQDAQALSAFFDGMPQKIPFAYREGDTHVYLWDLRKGLPDYLEMIGRERYPFHFKQAILPGQKTIYQEKNLIISFAPESLFDTLYLETQFFPNSIRIGRSTMPLFTTIDVSFTSEHSPQDSLKTQAFYAGRYRQIGKWENASIHFKTRYLGAFFLYEDQKPPEVKLLKKTNKALVFEITDDLAGIADYHARLNGQFILLDYEPKTRHLKTKLSPNQTSMRGNFTLEVIDGAGNQQIMKVVL